MSGTYAGQSLEVALRDDELAPSGKLALALQELLAGGADPESIASVVQAALAVDARTVRLVRPVSLRAARAYAEEASRTVAGQSGRDRASSDGELAPRLHWALRPMPRDASRQGFWVALLAAPEFAAYAVSRWSAAPASDTGPEADEEDDQTAELAQGVPSVKRLVGTDWNRHSLSRLWWIAELCRDGSDYRPVAEVFKAQDVMNQAGRSLYFRNRNFLAGWSAATLEFWNRRDLPEHPNFVKRKRIRWASAATQMALAGIVLDTRFSPGPQATTREWESWCAAAPSHTADESSDIQGPSFGRVEQSIAREARRWTDSLYREFEHAVAGAR